MRGTTREEGGFSIYAHQSRLRINVSTLYDKLVERFIYFLSRAGYLQERRVSRADLFRQFSFFRP